MSQKKNQYVQLVKGTPVQIEQDLLEIMLSDDQHHMFIYGATRASKRRKLHNMCYSLAPRP